MNMDIPKSGAFSFLNTDLCFGITIVLNDLLLCLTFHFKTESLVIGPYSYHKMLKMRVCEFYEDFFTRAWIRNLGERGTLHKIIV